MFTKLSLTGVGKIRSPHKEQIILYYPSLTHNTLKSHIRKFNDLSLKEKILFIKAFMLLGIVRTAILTIPFKRLTRSLEQHTSIKSGPALSSVDMDNALLIGKAIERAAQHTPWQSTCLTQALTAHRMLYKRNIPGVFYLGVLKERPETAQAHAWSQCGDTILTGESGHESFTVVSVFLWKKQT